MVFNTFQYRMSVSSSQILVKTIIYLASVTTFAMILKDVQEHGGIVDYWQWKRDTVLTDLAKIGAQVHFSSPMLNVGLHLEVQTSSCRFIISLYYWSPPWSTIQYFPPCKAASVQTVLICGSLKAEWADQNWIHLYLQESVGQRILFWVYVLFLHL